MPIAYISVCCSSYSGVMRTVIHGAERRALNGKCDSRHSRRFPAMISSIMRRKNKFDDEL